MFQIIYMQRLQHQRLYSDLDSYSQLSVYDYGENVYRVPNRKLHKSSPNLPRVSFISANNISTLFILAQDKILATFLNFPLLSHQ